MASSYEVHGNPQRMPRRQVVILVMGGALGGAIGAICSDRLGGGALGMAALLVAVDIVMFVSLLVAAVMQPSPLARGASPARRLGFIAVRAGPLMFALGVFAGVEYWLSGRWGTNAVFGLGSILIVAVVVAFSAWRRHRHPQP